MNKCSGKHTSYQPTDDEWKCPECGADNQYFYIDFANYDDCDLLHVDDVVTCCSPHCVDENGESKVWSGKDMAMIMQAGRIKCSCCKGTGYVQGE